MIKGGPSLRWGSIRRLSGIGAALVLLVVGVAVFGLVSGSGASTNTSVSSFTAKPSLLTWIGGSATLSATVSSAKQCVFSAKPAVKGLPATKSCTNGTVDEKVTVPKNTGPKITYTFGLSVTGTTTVKARPTTVARDF
jgi:hypothetical protein